MVRSSKEVGGNYETLKGKIVGELLIETFLLGWWFGGARSSRLKQSFPVFSQKNFCVFLQSWLKFDREIDGNLSKLIGFLSISANLSHPLNVLSHSVYLLGLSPNLHSQKILNFLFQIQILPPLIHQTLRIPSFSIKFSP
jgi:hypothetical protein